MSENKIRQNIKPVSRRKATIANLTYQYSSLVLGIIRGLVLVPLYLKFIDIKLYGAWLASGNVIVWLALMDPGLNELLRQQVAKFYGRKDWDNVGKAIGTGWILMAGLSIITVAIGWVISKAVPALFLNDPEKINELSISILLGSIGAALVFFSGSPGSVLQGFQRSGRVVVIYIFSWILGITCTIVLLFMKFGLVSIPLGSVTSGVIMSLCCSADMVYFATRRLHVHLRWCSEYLSNIKSLVGATFLLQTSRVLTVNCDEFLVGIFLGAEVVPIMAFTKKLWGIALMFGQRISVAFMPGLAHLWGQGNRQKVSEIAIKMLNVTMWLFGIEIAAILGFNRSFLGLWVGNQFFAGHAFNILMALSFALYVYVYAIGQILYASDDIKSPALAGAMQSLLRTILVLVLLAYVGILALPISTLVSSALMLGIYFRKRFRRQMSLKVYPNEFSAVLSLIVGMTLGLCGAYIIETHTWLSLIIGVIVSVFATGLVLFVADKAFKAFVSSVITKVFNPKVI